MECNDRNWKFIGEEVGRKLFGKWKWSISAPNIPNDVKMSNF